MRYKLLGRSGLRVSEMVLGTMTFGEDWGWGASREVSREIFDSFVEAGGNFIDTANNYTNGSAEKFVGEFIASNRDRFVVATKFTLNTKPNDLNAGGNHRKNMVRTLEGCLRNLNSDYVDIFWLHMWDFTTPVEEVMRGLDDLVRSGKVLHIGISDTPAWIVSKANTLAELRGWTQFIGLQVEYNLIERDVERDLLPMAQDFGLAVTSWGALAGGVLTGKYTDNNSEPRRYGETNLEAQKQAVIVEVQAIAKETGRSTSQVALNWVRQQQNRSQILPVIGARTTAHIKDNLACLEWELSAEQLQKLNQVSQIKYGFPHDFFNDLKGLAFGDHIDLLDK